MNASADVQQHIPTTPRPIALGREPLPRVRKRAENIRRPMAFMNASADAQQHIHAEKYLTKESSTEGL